MERETIAFANANAIHARQNIDIGAISIRYLSGSPRALQDIVEMIGARTLQRKTIN